MACLLDGAGKHPLVAGAGARLATRANLALIRDEALQHIDFFIIDDQLLVSAELAKFWAGIETAFTAFATFHSSTAYIFF